MNFKRAMKSKVADAALPTREESNSFGVGIHFSDLQRYENEEGYLYELAMPGNPDINIQIIQYQWNRHQWCVRVCGCVLCDDKGDLITFDTPEDAFDELIRQLTMIAKGKKKIYRAFPHVLNLTSHNDINQMIDFLM